MCGIAGIIASEEVPSELPAQMGSAILHRGPDDHGIWTDPAAGIALVHRRLSIVDLSPQGHQPMVSADGRWVIVYNGEVYNHAALRAELDASGGTPEGGWRGHSDTETVLHAIGTWGLPATLERLVGMFAFALWDRQERLLSLVRDRFGEKPLYYGWAGRDFLFGSELKALRVHPRFDGEIDRSALRAYAARTYIPAPLSIYKRIYKLQPGCVLTVAPEIAREPTSEAPRPGWRSGRSSLTQYWTYRDVLTRGMAHSVASEQEALELLEQSLGAAIKGQSMADVPVGAFLSGGIDSSTVVALYQRHSSTPVRTFSIGFEEGGFNEAESARRVATHLGTVHEEHVVRVQEARDVIPLLPAMYDEPFADSSQIPTHLVSRFARQKVTVALTGDGGDELFGGYNRHFLAPWLWKCMRFIPLPMRAIAAQPLGKIPPGVWQGLAGTLPGQESPHFGGKFQKTLRIAGNARRFEDVYLSFLDEWSLEPNPVLDASRVAPGFDFSLAKSAPSAVRMMYCDAVTYLPDDILCKVDRASMAVSLETRVPFLDHRVAEVAARIPLHMKIHGRTGKHILRELLYRHAPREIFQRPKAGFAIPVGQWIRGPLRSWAEDLLDPGRMAAEGWFDPAIVQRRWRDHIEGRSDSTPAIWAILMFQAWQRDQQQPLAKAA
jgi:asparagine synthase (glutamine-hydrolysing)